MAKFIALASFDGPIRVDVADRPAPDPATFGLPTSDDASRNDLLVGQNMISGSHFEPDFDALRAASARIVIGVGAESGTAIAGRGAKAVAERLGMTPVMFPGGHDGFVGGEYHPTGQPDAFATTLRRVLDDED